MILHTEEGKEGKGGPGLHLHIERLALNGSSPLIHRLQLHIPPGAVHTVMGASGSGKSSLLAAVCGTLPGALVLDCHITLNARRIDLLPTEQRRVGILFQDDLLFPHMTVRQNLLFAVPPGPKALREAAVAQALADVELPSLAHADPATLSGGQRTRIAWMRALLAQPQALLLDEPFAKLDAALRQRMRAFLFATVRARQIPVLLVTHDRADVADAQRLTCLT
jgi:putative thiamine transport system ATP-binding protein